MRLGCWFSVWSGTSLAAFRSCRFYRSGDVFGGGGFAERGVKRGPHSIRIVGHTLGYLNVEPIAAGCPVDCRFSVTNPRLVIVSLY